MQHVSNRSVGCLWILALMRIWDWMKFRHQHLPSRISTSEKICEDDTSASTSRKQQIMASLRWSSNPSSRDQAKSGLWLGFIAIITTVSTETSKWSKASPVMTWRPLVFDRPSSRWHQNNQIDQSCLGIETNARFEVLSLAKNAHLHTILNTSTSRHEISFSSPPRINNVERDSWSSSCLWGPLEAYQKKVRRHI